MSVTVEATRQRLQRRGERRARARSRPGRRRCRVGVSEDRSARRGRSRSRVERCAWRERAQPPPVAARVARRRSSSSRGAAWSRSRCEPAARGRARRAGGPEPSRSRERVEPGEQLVQVRDDQSRRRRRRGGAHVCREIAQRCVLLVPDGRDDRHRAAREGPNDALVAERQEIFEATAAASDDDDVDAGCAASARERGDRRGAPGPGHASPRRRSAPAGSACRWR